MEMALQDLRGKANHLPVYELLGGAVRRSVTVMKMVGLNEPEEMAEEAVTLVQQGFKALKGKCKHLPYSEILNRCQVQAPPLQHFQSATLTRRQRINYLLK